MKHPLRATVLTIGLTAGLTMTALIGHAQSVPAGGDRVAAVVNSQIITEADLDAHCRLAEVLQPSATADRKTVCRQTLRRMIDNELQRQYAESRKIAPTSTQTAQAKAMSEEKFRTIPADLQDAAQAELASEVLWQSIMSRAVQPQVQVSTAEVDKILKEMNQDNRVQERQIAQIMMRVPADSDDARVKMQMEEVLGRLQKGEDFAALARVYSDGAEKDKGGDMGWFGAGQLNAGLEKQLNGMDKGATSGLIRTPEGWHLVKLMDERRGTPVATEPVTQVELIVVGREVAATKKAEKKQKDRLEDLTDELENADAVAVRAFLASKAAAEWDKSSDLGWSDVNALQPELRKAVVELDTGTFSRVKRIGNQDVVIYKAGQRTVMPEGLEEFRAKIQERLFRQKAEQDARKFMQDLRQRAFVDVRA